MTQTSFFLARHSAPLSTQPVAACDVVLSSPPLFKVLCFQGYSHFNNKEFFQAESHNKIHRVLQLSQDIVCHVS